MIKKDINIWYGTIKRAFIVGGLFFFGNATTLGLTNLNIKGAFIVAGLYMFLELAKKYGLSIAPKDLIAKQKLNNYRYMIFP